MSIFTGPLYCKRFHDELYGLETRLAGWKKGNDDTG